MLGVLNQDQGVCQVRGGWQEMRSGSPQGQTAEGFLGPREDCLYPE